MTCPNPDMIDDVDVPSTCAEGLPEELERDFHLPCFLCKDICLYDLFDADTEKKCSDAIKGISSEVLRAYLNELYDRKFFYECSSYPYRNSDGILVKDVVNQKISILEKLIGERKT